MKHFSEAIRDGSKRNPQCTEGWSGRNEKGEVTTCAAVAGAIDLGCMVERDGIVTHGPNAKTRLGTDWRTGQLAVMSEPPKQIQPLLYHVTECPCECKTQQSVFVSITHLNDEHHWTREAIAEWVETVERKLGMWDENKKEEKQTEEVSTPVVVGECVECESKVVGA